MLLAHRPDQKITTDFNQPTLEKLYQLLYDETGVDFLKYKSGTIKRRLFQSMQESGMNDMDEYYHHLQKNPVDLRKLFEHLLIPLTSFFRNPKLFAVLKDEIFPSILSPVRLKGTLRIWVPGCSTGEEVYSIAICLAEVLNHFHNSVDIRIFGTDVNAHAIEKARNGTYSIESLNRVSSKRLKRFFVKTAGGYKVSNLIRSFCMFTKQNLLVDPPLNHLDIISCQNVLIYLTPMAHKPILDSFRFALNPGGFLILGESEAISVYQPGFKKWKQGYSIYSKTAHTKIIF